MTAFWILAPVMVLAALGILFVRKAVHAALLLAVVIVVMPALAIVTTRGRAVRPQRQEAGK